MLQFPSNFGEQFMNIALRVVVYIIGAISLLWLVGFLRIIGQVDWERGTLTLFGLFIILLLVANFEQNRRSHLTKN